MELSKGSQNELPIHALKNNFEADAYFVNVIALQSESARTLCHVHLRRLQRISQKLISDFICILAGQLSQSAHFALQLPYTVLGLGRSANFLDHLYVGTPRPPGETATRNKEHLLNSHESTLTQCLVFQAIRKQEWTAIIPNSQLIIIPYPHNNPHSWSAKLYLTPGNLVLLTAIALIAMCIFILTITGILHWQGKVSALKY
ncbi:UNVERIFIED_CONTAM: hypothetical protein FKN15_055593 [Acipenser sinensis]